MTGKKKPWDNFTICLAAGLCLTGISVLLFAVLGTDSVFVYHDQMDGEVLCYLYQAKYLFKDSPIPEFMNGAGKNALTPPAPLFVLLYKILPPFAAFVTTWYVSALVGFTGMYLWLVRLKITPFAGCICGVLFAYLPLLPVYGLSMYGVPLAAWALWKLADTSAMQGPGRKLRFMQAGLLLLLAAYAAASSFVLSGFVVLGLSFLAYHSWLVLKPARKSKAFLAGGMVLLVSWLFCNQTLFSQILGLKGGYVTHKEEMIIAAEPFFARLIQTFLHGLEHAQAYQRWIVLLAAGIITAGILKKKWRNREWKRMICFVGAAFAVAFLCAFYTWEPVVAVRRSIGGPAVWFQLDRIYWLYPALWYTILGLAVQWLYGICKATEGNGKRKKNTVWAKGIIVAALLAAAIDAGSAGVWKDNVKAVLGRETSGISWKDFYAEDIYAQIEEYLYETTGQKQEDYRVASLGICPAAALYNGFYCLDGYSNNYPLEYKHAFRQIIKPELDKSPYLTDYFDWWGNRCYLFSAQIPGYYTIEKGGFYFSGFEMDTEAFESLGGTYVFSAAYIENAEKTGLKLLREEPFSNDDSYYQIYVYELMRKNGD